MTTAEQTAARARLAMRHAQARARTGGEAEGGTPPPEEEQVAALVLRGKQGEPGPQGPQGPEGPQGPGGPEGRPGARGDDGVDGEPGPEGKQGPKGEQGEQGETGPPGEKCDGVHVDKYGNKTSWEKRGEPGLFAPVPGVGPAGPQGPAGDPATNLVTSVAGRQGVVVLTKTDVGLANVDNTSDATKDAATSTLSNKRIAPRVTTIVSSATPTINTDVTDAVSITALAAAITSMTTNLTGTPNNFDKLLFRIKDDGSARAITWGASFAQRLVALPTTTVAGKVLLVGFFYDTVSAKWGCVASGSEL